MAYQCSIISYEHIAEFDFGSERKKSGEPIFTVHAELNQGQLNSRLNKLWLQGADGQPLWPTPFECDGRINKVHHSDNRILCTTFSSHYHRWGTLGPVYLIELKTGKVIKTLKGQRAKSLSGGRFILGLEGYDYFDTWLCEPDGTLSQKWKSFGYYVVSGKDDIRVLEADRRRRTKARVARLLNNGEVQKGDRLFESAETAPQLLEDGTILFVDNGVLRVFDEQLKDVFSQELRLIPKDASHRTWTDLYCNDDGFVVEMFVRSASSNKCSRFRWVLQLTSG